MKRKTVFLTDSQLMAINILARLLGARQSEIHRMALTKGLRVIGQEQNITIDPEVMAGVRELLLQSLADDDEEDPSPFPVGTLNE